MKGNALWVQPTAVSYTPDKPDPPPPPGIDLGGPEESQGFPAAGEIRDGSYPLAWSALAAAVQVELSRDHGSVYLQALANARAPGGTGTVVTGPNAYAPQMGLLAWPDGILCCWRGTSNFSQYLGFILGSALTLPLSIRGYVNSGFYAGGLIEAARLAERMPDPATPIILSGHSYGGAVAQIVAALRTAGGNVPRGVLGWGTPRVGTSAFGDGIGCPVVRTENSGDPVTGLPPTQGLIAGAYRWLTLKPLLWDSYIHAGRQWGLGPDGNLYRGEVPMSTLSNLVALLTSIDQGLEFDFDAHDMGEYARRAAVRWEGLSNWSGLGFAQPDLITRSLLGTLLT